MYLRIGNKTIAKITLSLFVVMLIGLAATLPSSSVLANSKTRKRADKALREGEFETAAKLYREVLSEDSRDAQARLGLSYALLKQRLLRDAYDHAARVIMADPLSARAHALLGASILASGDFRDSVEEFKTALSLQENEAMAIAGLAMVDFYENRLE